MRIGQCWERPHLGMEAPETTHVSGLRERLQLSECSASWVGGAFGQLHISRGELVWWSGQCVLNVWLNEKLGGSAGGRRLQREAQQIASMHLDLFLGSMVPGPVTADTGVL